MWYYGDIEFTSEMINDYTGFVYVITDLNNKKKYVGKKLFFTGIFLRIPFTQLA